MCLFFNNSLLYFYLTVSKEMADQENAHEEITHGPGYTPSYSPLGITPSPSTTHAHLATPNESIVAHEQ